MAADRYGQTVNFPRYTERQYRTARGVLVSGGTVYERRGLIDQRILVIRPQEAMIPLRRKLASTLSRIASVLVGAVRDIFALKFRNGLDVRSLPLYRVTAEQAPHDA